MGIFKSVGGILNIFASLVLLPALVICFGERRAAITMMCFGLSGFVLMGFSGVAAGATVPGDGSTANTMPADAGAGRWAREACMVVGFPLHNMVRCPQLPHPQWALVHFSAPRLSNSNIALSETTDNVRPLQWFNVGTIYTAIGTQAVDKNMIASILSLWQFLNTFALSTSPSIIFTTHVAAPS